MGVMLLGWLEVVVLLVVVISALITTSYLTTAIGKNTLKTDEIVHAFMFVCVCVYVCCCVYVLVRKRVGE